VCLYICLSTTKFHQIFYTRYLWSWLDPPVTAMRYVMHFWFVNDVMFSHNRANGRESEMKRMCCRVLQGGGTGDKSAVSDCILFILFVYFVYQLVYHLMMIQDCQNHFWWHPGDARAQTSVDGSQTRRSSAQFNPCISVLLFVNRQIFSLRKYRVAVYLFLLCYHIFMVK